LIWPHELTLLDVEKRAGNSQKLTKFDRGLGSPKNLLAIEAVAVANIKFGFVYKSRGASHFVEATSSKENSISFRQFWKL